MTTKTEQILEAIKTAIAAGGITVERNTVVPESIAAGGLVILRDGDPGEAQRVLNSTVCYYDHLVVIEVFSQSGDDEDREEVFDTLLASLDVALSADNTFGGLADGSYATKPSIETVPVGGGAGIKQGIVTLLVGYSTATALG